MIQRVCLHPYTRLYELLSFFCYKQLIFEVCPLILDTNLYSYTCKKCFSRETRGVLDDYQETTNQREPHDKFIFNIHGFTPIYLFELSLGVYFTV